ncbi:MAG: hypothetical protein KJ622_12290 [Alphaproteobacteria bacterium]|nr:hypothetical protein [Alphaproteobacteria bacterium]
MFRLKAAPTRLSHRIDLDTVRETITYIRDDVAADPALAGVADALDRAIVAIDNAAPSECRPIDRSPPFSARFFANR